MSKRTNKTAHVMRLLSNAPEGVVNPLIDKTFKEDVILVRAKNAQSTQPDEEPPKPDVAIVRKDDVAAQQPDAVNVTSELVYELIPSVLGRFHCCNCEVCRAEVAIEALSQMPPHYVRTDGDFAAELEAAKQKCRQEVMSQLVRVVIAYKRVSAHNQET